MEKIIFAIETSCDDTSIAILKNNLVLSCVTSNDLKRSDDYGGIVPEIVSRNHEKVILKTAVEALNKANIDWKDVTHIAYTSEPGLVGSLFIGKIFAKTLAFMLDIKAYEINHIHGHIFSPFINSKPQYPFLSLIASGKTTSIFLVKNENEIIELTKTLDDAIGEVFDKVGKALGYNYPAGPLIDQNFDIKKTNIKFFKPKIEQDFSFSGIKNKVITMIKNLEKQNKYIDKIEIGSSFMKWAIDNIINKLNFYSKKYNCKNICIGGGVAANSYFKSEIKKIFLNSYVPKKEFATDNAAMIGYFFQLKFKNI